MPRSLAEPVAVYFEREKKVINIGKKTTSKSKEESGTKVSDKVESFQFFSHIFVVF